MRSLKPTPESQDIKLPSYKANSDKLSQEITDSSIRKALVRATDYNDEYMDLIKEPGIYRIACDTNDLSSTILHSEKAYTEDEKVCKSKTTLTSSEATIPQQHIGCQTHNKGDINEYPQYPISAETLKTLEGTSIHGEGEKYSLEAMNQSAEKRRNILRTLNEEEQIKYIQIEENVVKLGLPYREIDMMQFLIVSHWDLQECLDRMKRLQQMYKEYKTDTVKLADAFIQVREITEIFTIGGCDPDGRRVFVANFGKIPAAKTLEEFPTFSKVLSMVFDSLNVTLSEIHAGVAFVGDFKGYGTSNWSLKLFVKFMKMWQYNYPSRVRRIYLINTPMFFWVIARFVMAFTSKKFKDRFRFVSVEDLQKVVPKTSLPPSLGGTYEETKNVVPWIQKRLKQRCGQDWELHYS